jgi:hypothetical protein
VKHLLAALLAAVVLTPSAAAAPGLATRRTRPRLRTRATPANAIDQGDLDKLLAVLHRAFDRTAQPVPGEVPLEGWQSGLLRPDWSAKPSFLAYRDALQAVRSGTVRCPAWSASSSRGTVSPSTAPRGS